jgi:hypothetical protein
MATLQLLVDCPSDDPVLRYWKLSGPKYRTLFEVLRRLPYRAYTPHQGWAVDDDGLAVLRGTGLQVKAGRLKDEDLTCADWATTIFARDWLPFSPDMN